MIADFFLQTVYLVLVAVTYPLTLFEDVAFSTDLLTAISAINGYYSTANQAFPVDTLLLAFAIMLLTETVIFFFKLFQWAIKKLPFIS